MIDHLHNLASVLAFTNQIGGSIHVQLQHFYDWFMDCFGKSFFAVDVIGGTCFTVAIFWMLGLLYTVLDLTKWPKCLYQYKTQDKDVMLK